MVIFEKLIGELQSHRYIYAALVILHITLLVTNGFGTGFQNPPIAFEAELDYGSPVNQNIGQTINITEFPTNTDIILVNKSPNADIYYYFSTYLPVHDCEIIEFNATVEVLSDVAKVTMQVALFGREDIVSTTFNDDIQTGSTTISIQITKQMTQVTDWNCVNPLELRLFSPDTMIIRNIIGRAVSSIKLCPVTIDILTTENNSITHYDPGGYTHAYPRLNLTQDNTNHTSVRLHSWEFSHSPIFLEPGNYSGEVYWGDDPYWINPRTPVNLEIEENQRAEWRIRLLTMRIGMYVDPNLSSYDLWIDENHDNIFHSYSTNASLPRFVFAPVVNSSIQVRSRLSTDLPIIFFPRIPEAQILVNGSHNLVYTLRYPYPVVLNTVLTPYQIALLLYLPALSLILLTRVVLLAEPSGPKRTWLNLRLVPILGMLLAAATPWFFSSHIQHDYLNDVYFSVYRAFFFPFFFQTTWTDGSMAVAFAVTDLIPTDIVSISFPVLFYWIPLAYAAARIRTDTDSFTNTEFSVTLLFILFFSGAGLYAVSIESEPIHFPGPGLIIVFLSFVVWIVGPMWMDFSRKYLKKEKEFEASIKEKDESGI